MKATEVGKVFDMSFRVLQILRKEPRSIFFSFFFFSFFFFFFFFFLFFFFFCSFFSFFLFFFFSFFSFFLFFFFLPPFNFFVVHSKQKQESDIFLYVGHSGGEQFFNNRKVENLSVNSTVLLMGCSSASPRVEGDYSPNGIALSYLSAGAPCVVGNLWSITDVDGDSFAAEMLSIWLGEDEGEEGEEVTVAHAVAQAREVCQLSYSVGAAAVCVGFPVGLAPT